MGCAARLAVLAGFPLVDTPAYAQDGVPARSANVDLAFDIPRSSLQIALERYSAVTRLQILYSAQVVAGKQAGPMRGVFTAEVALALLLRDTGLRARRTGPRSITLFAAANESTALPVLAIRSIRVEAPAGPNPLYLRYAERLVAMAARAIRSDAVTGSGDYTVRVRLWLAENGAVSRASVSRASRGAAPDGDIARVLRGVTAGDPPPEGMTQPLIYDFRIGYPG